MAQSPKKPNSFSKGMMSDLDANIIPAENYKSATNARLISREDDSFVLKNAEGNSVFDTINISEQVVTFSDSSILENSDIVNLPSATFSGFQLTVSGDNGFVTETFSFVVGEALGSWAGLFEGYVVDLSGITPDSIFVVACVQMALASESVSDATSISFSANEDDSYSVTYSSPGSTAITLSFSAYIGYVENSDFVYDYFPLAIVNGYTAISYPAVIYDVVALANFSDYMIAITTSSNGGGDDAIFKFTQNTDGSLYSRTLMLQANLGLVDKTSIRMEVSEENEHFHRIYWTDGVQPLRTLNLKESPSYYSNLSANDLNVFKAAQLEAPDVVGIVSGGNVSCGSHSYCYRLVTTDGKSSRVSGITNPIQILKTNPLTDYHESLGGSLSTNSSNAVQLTVNGIDGSYSTIQIINITYTSAEGAIIADIISESVITSESFSYTHNGNETTTSISVGELLRSHVSWDTCADLAIKDNRLFAANLKNNAESVDLDFRVKSYKYAMDGTGSASTYNGTSNPDIHRDTMYEDGNYGWINAVDTGKIPGAETVGFDASEDGVRVTFATKTFDLSKVQYFNNSETLNDDSNVHKAETTVGKVPHYGFLEQTQVGGYNNYKNPLFTKDYTGYQRGEVYRFGILFYDKAGNPTFVNPIGDIRMPDGTMDYFSNDSSGNIVSANEDGVTTFKHAGNIPKRSYSWGVVMSSSVITKTDGGIGVNLHDVVSGSGIPQHTTVSDVAADGHSVTLSRPATSTGPATTITFDTPTDDVKGFALYPQFNVKLSAATRAKIGGYSIVRVDRKQLDKSVLASGVINQSIIHSNNSGNGTLRHKNGHHYGNIYSGRQDHECLSDSDFTLDTPEIVLGKLQYEKKSGDKIKVVGRFDAGAQELNDESFPYDNTVTNQGDFKHLKQGIGNGLDSNSTGSILSGRFNPNTSTNNNCYQYSQKVIYSQYKSSIEHVRKVDKGEDIKEVEYGAVVAPGASIDKARMGFDDHGTGRTGHNFLNRCRFNYGSYVFSQFPEGYTGTSYKKYNSNEINADNAVTLFGITSLFFSLGPDSGDEIKHSAFEIGTPDMYTYSPFVLNRADTNRPHQAAFASKLYVQLKRDVSAVQYGGSSQSNYESNQYISTGHVRFSPTADNVDSIFGGDTYINMHSLKKWFVGATTFSSKPFPATAIVFPVESSINIDLRDGVFFGATDDTQASVEDNFFLNETYGSRNTSKTFLQKPASFKDVNGYSNLVAASNLKLAGNLFDAFTTWDSGEIHELDSNKGAIYSIFNLRNELFAVQQNGVSKLSVNPRVVADNADAAAVTIVTGTGQVIQRSDYIDTMYGSQHFNNMLVTNTSAYWYDGHMSSFCKLVYGQGVAVQDLGITTQNSNIFHSLRDLSIADKPLDISVGGICLYHNKIFDEVGVCVTTSDKTVQAHLVYSELNDVMVTKKEDIVALAVNMPGELITIGRNSNDIAAQYNNILWRENSNSSRISYYGTENTNSLDVTFVCNENVYSSKKFDKLVMYLSGNENEEKFTTFTFTDSVSNTPFTTTGAGSRMANGKHIIPITNTEGTVKATGQYLIVQAKSTNTGKIELFGALIHNRATR